MKTGIVRENGGLALVVMDYPPFSRANLRRRCAFLAGSLGMFRGGVGAAVRGGRGPLLVGPFPRREVHFALENDG